MAEEGKEYRVVWQREGRVQQVKRYTKPNGAELRYALLTSNEPWTLLGHEAGDFICCAGARQQCGCGGETYQQQTERIRKESPLKYVRIESRPVGEWAQHATE